MGRVLDGFTVGITADRRSDEQASLFERRGAAVMLGPAIRTLPLGEDDGLRAATEDIIASPPDALVANTGLGIRSWFGAAESWDLGDALLGALASARVYARGPKAAGAVHSLGIEVVARTSSERLHDCIELVLADLPAGGRVAVQRDGGPSSPALSLLHASGASVLEVPVYRWELNDDPRAALRLADAVIGGRVHAVTFTSSPAITSWLSIAAADGMGQLLRAALGSGRVVVGCVGPVCAEALVAEGMGDGDVVVPRSSRLGPLVRAVAERLAERSKRVGSLLISGNVVQGRDGRVELTDIEARILSVLAGREGAVVSKVELLADVWGDPAGDPHAVEVAVGRLRRRLGTDGAAVVMVPRRGYVLR
ncbi:MAG: uroporphyrinogen-III synthase [Microthrixaceae bacterium]